MASPNIYPTGIGGSSGSSLATGVRLEASGSVWYVHSGTGSDAGTPRGKERIRPLATLAQAYTNASAGDIICFLAGHTETITSAQTLNKEGLTLIGEGTGSNRPKFTRDVAANGRLFNITAINTVLDNLYFPQSTTASTGGRINFGAVGCQMLNCQVDCGANDTGAALELNSSDARIYNTSFTSTATLLTAQPESAINVALPIANLELDTVVFDGGTTGWSNPYAMYPTAGGALTRFRAYAVDMLNDSDVEIHSSSTGYFNVRNRSGSARVVWNADPSASPQVYTNGIGASSGSNIATTTPLYTSGYVWYVNSATGQDGASPRGLDRAHPLATVEQAHTNASSGDIIVVAAGHTQTISSSFVISKQVFIFGEGSGSQIPRFTRATGDFIMFHASAAGVYLDNLYFARTIATSGTSAKVRFEAAGSCRNCYFEGNQIDQGPQLEVASAVSPTDVRGCTFYANPTESTRPSRGFVVNSGTFADVTVDNCTFDGNSTAVSGNVGWGERYAFWIVGVVTRLRATNLRMLNTSNMFMQTTGTGGYIHVSESTGGSRVEWTF